MYPCLCVCAGRKHSNTVRGLLAPSYLRRGSEEKVTKVTGILCEPGIILSPLPSRGPGKVRPETPANRTPVPLAAHVFGGCLSSCKTFSPSLPLGQCSTCGPRWGSETLARSQYTLVAWLLTAWMELEGTRCQPGI